MASTSSAGEVEDRYDETAPGDDGDGEEEQEELIAKRSYFKLLALSNLKYERLFARGGRSHLSEGKLQLAIRRAYF